MDEADPDRPHPREVRRTYDRIGTHFSKTRVNPWPEVEAFVRAASKRTTGRPAVALDVGCGNGRHAAVLAGAAEQVLAVDASRTLLATARERLAEAEATDVAVFADDAVSIDEHRPSTDTPDVRLLQGDAERLPLSADSVDLAVYVATLHHLSGRERRLASLDDLAQVLRADGRGLVSAWSTAHDRFDAPADAETGFDTTVDWTLPSGTVVDRFYHVYAPAEFRRDVRDSALAVERVRVSSGNCYARVRGRS